MTERDTASGRATGSGSPSFNHTRGDSQFDPCPKCLPLMSRYALIELVKDLRAALDDLNCEQREVDRNLAATPCASDAELDSPNFVSQAAKDLEARGFERINRASPKASDTCPDCDQVKGHAGSCIWTVDDLKKVRAEADELSELFGGAPRTSDASPRCICEPVDLPEHRPRCPDRITGEAQPIDWMQVAADKGAKLATLRGDVCEIAEDAKDRGHESTSAELFAALERTKTITGTPLKPMAGRRSEAAPNRDALRIDFYKLAEDFIFRESASDDSKEDIAACEDLLRKVYGWGRVRGVADVKPAPRSADAQPGLIVAARTLWNSIVDVNGEVHNPMYLAFRDALVAAERIRDRALATCDESTTDLSHGVRYHCAEPRFPRHTTHTAAKDDETLYVWRVSPREAPPETGPNASPDLIASLRGSLEEIRATAAKGDGISHWEDCDARGCPEECDHEEDEDHGACSCTIGMLDHVHETAGDALDEIADAQPSATPSSGSTHKGYLSVVELDGVEGARVQVSCQVTEVEARRLSRLMAQGAVIDVTFPDLPFTRKAEEKQ